MNASLGTYSLMAAILIAAASLVACLAAWRFNSRQLLLGAKVGIGLLFASLTLASIALLIALVNSDFNLQYVVHYTILAMPKVYKVVAFWAGQEGSLLLWAWLLAGMSVIAVLGYRLRHPESSKGSGRSKEEILRCAQNDMKSEAVFVAVLAVVIGFFAVLMLFAHDANPFQTIDGIVDGRGMNPLLRDPGMIAHPPLLFLGYAGYTIPFALMMAALAGGKRDNAWVGLTRRWSIISWIFLTVGILLGSEWAYTVLGWGGYWSWDAVENASLLPWLTGTALLHSIMVQQHRGMLKIWNVGLIAVTFILCIFGTYLTRSGVVNSVHSFGKPEAGTYLTVGNFFLVFLILVALVILLTIIFRLGFLKSENRLEGMLGREGAFLITNVLLTGIMLVVLVGTIWPILSNLFAGRRIEVEQPFYNHVVLPMALVLVALMAIGPMLRYGNEPAARLARGLIVPGILAAVVAIVMCVMGIHNPWALACGIITTVALVVVGLDLGHAVSERIKAQKENAVVAALRLMDGNHRRYGGQFAHLGMMMIVVGIAGSSLYSTRKMFQIIPGESAKIGQYTLTFNNLEKIQTEEYDSLKASVALTDAAGRTRILYPEKRTFYKWEDQPNSVVGLQSGWGEDLYITLAVQEEHDRYATAIGAMINPLVLWIWIGGIVMTLGGLFCLLPRLVRPEETVAVQVTSKKAKGRHAVAMKGI